ncbi:uncharacterized protein B0I36DRAFT_336238 [Microdochium trichocladiopsis]|uniref:DUF676 domain-containing protein n=1 Tax=Microdochium trichocladiopsis TaxID=1682393 RepID=A0A9P8XUX2_9PEZI|nr:uncharacterized protein B0I36DRAFT_336238 [Microdochium trichocladiopsis]KAH7018577.1 hypothetical protein B0I36DRAFT_336238 [Microdochium trichocladiopsis]
MAAAATFSDDQAGPGTRMIRVHSLALEPHGLSQTATVSLADEALGTPPRSLPCCTSHPGLRDGQEEQWVSEIDEHFLGLTTLYALPPDDHMVDILAISGLGSHAFGSFKQRGGEHMWLRDALPSHIVAPQQQPGSQAENTTGSRPIARVMIYGYSSPVAGSSSVQNVDDLAGQLRQQLLALVAARPNGDHRPQRPIVILSHSLGGLILKETIISLASSQDSNVVSLRSAIGGLVFFGVPHLGMDIASLEPMAGRKGPNRALLLSIGQDNSQFLSRQTRKFPAALEKLGSPQRPAEVFCFYETAESPTPVWKDGKWAMDGPKTMLVSVPSATYCIPQADPRNHTCAINRSHSELVKYAPHDDVYDLVRSKLQEIVTRAVSAAAPHPVHEAE